MKLCWNSNRVGQVKYFSCLSRKVCGTQTGKFALHGKFLCCAHFKFQPRFQLQNLRETTKRNDRTILFRRVSQICLVSVKSDSQIRVGRSVENTSGLSKIVVKIWNSHKKLTEDSSKGFTPDSESRVFLVFRSVGRFTLTKHIPALVTQLQLHK